MNIINKKAVMGIGVLIIFIAGILVATVAAGVLLFTQDKLQDEALKTGADARRAVGTNIEISSIKGINVASHTFSDFEIEIKLGPSSDPIKLNKTTFTIVSSNSISTLLYGGENLNSYFTNKVSREFDWTIDGTQTRLKTDLDGDYLEDYVWVYNSTMLKFNLSEDADVNITIPNISSSGATINQNFNISSASEIYATLSISGTTTTTDELDSSMTITLIPETIGIGRYVVSFTLEGDRHQEDALKFGDVMKTYFEHSGEINEGRNLLINLNTPQGIPLSKNVVTPDVMTTSHITLFP